MSHAEMKRIEKRSGLCWWGSMSAAAVALLLVGAAAAASASDAMASAVGDTFLSGIREGSVIKILLGLLGLTVLLAGTMLRLLRSAWVEQIRAAETRAAQMAVAHEKALEVHDRQMRAVSDLAHSLGEMAQALDRRPCAALPVIPPRMGTHRPTSPGAIHGG